MTGADSSAVSRHRTLVAVLVGVLVAVLFALVASGDELKLIDQWPSNTSESSESRTVTTIVPETFELVPASASRLEIPWFITAFLTVLFWAAIALLVVLLVRYAWRNRPRLRLPRFRRRSRDDFDVLDDLATVMAADAAEQRATLTRGTPRNAIVACWLRLEAAVAEAGVVRRTSDTSAELTQRVLASQDVDPSAISALASLYREARFSEHVMTETSRLAAIEALDRVHSGLGSPARSAENAS